MKYYENSCQKIKFGKFVYFPTLIDPKKLFPILFHARNDQTFFHTLPYSLGTLHQQFFSKICKNSHVDNSFECRAL